MKYDQWVKQLESGGNRSYASQHPLLAKQILDGIINGINIDFKGDRKVNRFGFNLPVDFVNIAKVSEVIDKDVKALKKAGPFSEQPFEFMAISPIGAVPKKNSTKIRVIHHLSYPFDGDSVNEGIDDVYLPISSFGHAARAVRQLGKGCFLV